MNKDYSNPPSYYLLPNTQNHHIHKHDLLFEGGHNLKLQQRKLDLSSDLTEITESSPSPRTIADFLTE